MSDENVDEQVEDKFGTDADPVDEQDADSAALAEEALEEVAHEKTSKPAEESENLPTVETVANLRKQRREEREGRHAAEIEAAELRGKLSAQTDAQVVEQELSPVQTLMKEQGVTDENELDISPGEAIRLARQDAKWETAQTAKKSAADTETTRQSEAVESHKAAQAVDRGEGLDYTSIETLGLPFLDDGDQLMISRSPEPFEEAYRRLVKAIQERGDESTKKILQERLARKTEKSVEDPPPEKPEDNKKNETDDEEEQIVNPRLRALAADVVSGT